MRHQIVEFPPSDAERRYSASYSIQEGDRTFWRTSNGSRRVWASYEGAKTALWLHRTLLLWAWLDGDAYEITAPVEDV